jgi:hypothetical protein
MNRFGYNSEKQFNNPLILSHDETTEKEYGVNVWKKSAIPLPMDILTKVKTLPLPFRLSIISMLGQVVVFGRLNKNS